MRRPERWSAAGTEGKAREEAERIETLREVSR